MTNYWQRMWWTGALCCQTSSSRHNNGESYGSVHPILSQPESLRKGSITSEAALTPPSPTDAFLQRVEEYRSILPSARFNMEGRRQQGSQQKKKLSMGGGGGIGGSIRSPLVKRDQHSQVVIRGWLYKLEGALAMKQWKKRWFVLSDFCLFYYKDSDEEKLLGSILLPSYKINPCISEDRISKKFAFKAEHHNMKTYYFASDSKESMSQWMNAMSLATIMQKDTTCDVLAERGYGSPVLLDDEESGFSSYLPRRTPHHHSSTNPPSIAIMNNFNPDRHSRSHSGIVYPENLARSCEFENGYVEAEQKYSRSPGDGLVPRRQPGQPLYANAPPKPRRLTGTYHDQGAAGTDYPIEYSESRLSNYYPNNLQYRVPFSEQESLDYSSDWPPGMPYQDNYVYGSGYYPTSNHREANVRKETIEPIQNAHYHTGNPPRPHSADFLEKQSVVDPAYPQAVLSNQVKPRQRPKSSLEQYDRQHYWDDDTAPVSDHSHNYSYELVRENWSAHGLKRQSDYNIQTHALQNLDTSRSPNSSLYSESPSSTLRRSQPNMQGPVPIPFEYGLPDVPDHKTNFKSGVIENEPNLKDNEIPGLTKWPTMHPTKHPGYSVDPKFYSEREIVIRRPPHDHQTRPLSAEYKLGDPAYANNAHPNYQQQEQMMSDRDQKKVQLREESMKRLLEWKQRMLQSPLSRKYSPRSQPPGVDNSPRSSPSHSLGGRSNAQSHIPLETSPGTPTSPPARPPLPEEYRQKVLQDLENHEARLMMRENIIPPDSGPQHYGSYGPPSLLLKASDIGVENQPPYNNEIKLKTLEKSPPHIIAPVHPIKPAHSSLSAQQTLQTGDINISIESNDIPVFDTTCSFKGDSKSDSKNEIENSKYQSQMRNQDPRIKFPSSVNKLGQQQSYSSDDEEFQTKQRNRRKRHPSQAQSLAKIKNHSSEELSLVRSPQAPSPDYVNLNIVDRKQTSKSDSRKLDTFQSGYNLSKISSQSHYENDLNDNAEDENKDYYIRREDYYRASQLFYSKTKKESQVKSVSDKSTLEYDNQGLSLEFSMSTEERSLGDGIESSVDDNSTHKIETYQSDGKFRQQYDYCDSGLPLRGRDTKFDKTRIRSQSLPRKPSTYENFYPKPDVCQLYCENEKRFEEPALKRSSSTDMIESGEQTYGEFHRQTSLRNVSESKRNSSTLKHNYSFEEMRTQLAKQREAPPANIVSQRIKHFESSVETLDDAKKSSPPAIGIGELLTKGSGMESYAEEKREKQLKEPDCVYKITFENLPREDDSKVETIKLSKSLNANPNCISNENKLNWQHSFQRRHFCSDSDVGRSLCKKDSNSTTEDSSIASAPIVLSPLSSVLADLRRTADTKKETKRGGVDEVIITKGALRLSLAESKDMTSDCKSSEDSEVKKMEEEYLSMTKGKLTEDEAVYVAMDDDSTIPLYSSVPKVEPVYNEPVLPPSSFLHDIFGKQKRSKSLGGQLNSYSSSDESSNLYEKPNWKNVKEKASQNKADPTEENPVYEEPYSMTPYRQWDTKAKSKDSSTIEVEESIPDLLNHEENVRKDTDASDADDEASRDFDTPHHNHNGLPSYQKEILCGEHSLTELDNQFDQSRALPLIPKYPTYVVNKITKTEIPVKEAALAVSEATMRYVNSPNEDSAQSLPNDLREYKHFKVYEDERRCTEFVFKSELEKETTLLSPTVNLKQVRIYKEGKEPGKLKFYSHSANQLLENCSQPNTVRSKQKLSLDSQMETQHHLHIKPLHSYSDEASNTTDMSHSAKHAKSSSYDSSLQVKVASYTTPDVVPFEADENSILRKNLSTSAPYYYSDLLPNGLQAPCPQDHGDFHISPRSSRALLNNVRDVSPNQARGDIGRKVNVIQNTPIILNNASANEDSVSVAMARELRASLEQLLSPESKKFLDAERNKYEAGHTLEKTHHSSTLSKLKKRSSTPDFENHNNEPEYENVSATRNTSGNGLTRRLSRSLEGLIDLGPPMEDRQVAQELDLATREEPQLTSIDNEEPFYENIMFVRKENEHFRENDQCEMEMRTSSPYSREWDNNVSLARSDKDMSLIETSGSPDLFPQDIEKRDYGETIGQTLALNSLGDERDSDSEYLDENILRRESQRHFLAQGLGEKTAVGFTNKMKGISVSPKQASVSNPTINTPNSEENMLVETLSYQPQINHGLLESEVRASSCPKTVCREMPDYCGYVSSDSSSDLSFHRDPTSGDSVVATSDEHLSHQRQRHLSEISKDNLNSSDSELHKQTSSKVKRLIQRSQGLSREGKRLSISAGDLLEKSHEELVLLLIQLRRTLARVAKTREKCHAQLESSQLINLTRLGSSDKTLQNYEELKVQIQELERQYDMTQPLVNLVENMVKLGSLYRGHEKKTLAASTAKLMSYTGKDQIYTPSQNLVEFSNNIVGSDTQPENFHQGISCLYELNRGFYAESANLMSLHQDKDMLEYTLDSVKGKVNSAGDNTMLVQKLKKQQLLLEKELTRVRNLLSHSAAKIEELTKENVKQEKDILLLKQKVHQALKKSSLDKMPLARANLESELSRVQSVIEELSQQRMEVVSSIENLKQESQHSISSRSYSLLGPPVRASPTGAAGVIPLPLRRKCQTTYLETDLDSLETRDLACIPSHIYFGQKSDNPLYVNTVEIIDDKLGNESTVESPPESEYYNKNSLMSLESAEADRMFDDFYNSQPNDINEADERMKRFYGIIPREKPSEIKTVRIVKRESERRSRVRKKVSYDENHSLVWLVEEPDTLLSEDGEETDDGVFQEPFQGGQNRPTTLFFPPQAQSSFPSAREQLFGGQTSVCSPSSSSSEFRTPITPLFLLNKPQYPPTSQATTTSTSSLDYRAPFKKAKRRHYTISGSQPTLEQSWIKNNIGGLRSRDDMDMERCLRTVNTPDIVRSTIKKVDVFDEKLIERELSLPQKIVIPERYIEAEPPEELSASEKLRRKLKAETIRKMLSETTTYEDIADENGPTETLRKKLEEEKKKRAHLLALNHTIAKEVMERSKMVAVVATLERLDPKKIREEAKRRRQLEEDIRSPDVPLPLRQQRENFLT